MPSNVLPTDEEVLALTPGRDSITWRRAADARIFAGAGYALTLQVSHPVVGAGVLEHSDYKADPWGRLLRTLDFTNSLIYAEPLAAAAVCRNIRAMHTTIKGMKPDGTRYHALEPEPYAWVHATLFQSITDSHRLFGRPFRRDQEEQFWVEWRRLGRLLGVREQDLPPTLGGYRDYFDAKVQNVLENNQAVQDVIETMGQPADPPLPRAARPLWKMSKGASAHSLQLATVGMLPPVLRNRFGLGWTRANELELRAVGAMSRSVTPVMPKSLRALGPSYMRWRSEETARLARTAPPAPSAAVPTAA